MAESQIQKLNNKVEIKYKNEIVQKVQMKTSQRMKELGYEPFLLDGNSLMAKKNRFGNMSETDIGDLRVSFYNVPCGPTTIIA